MIHLLLCIALLGQSQTVKTTVATRCPVDDPWFLELQQEDGSWDADSFPEGKEGVVPGASEDDVAVTSMLVLASLGDGHTSSVGPYRGHLARAMRWLISQQTGAGRIGQADHGRALHHHALATLVLSENHYLGGRPDHSAQARRAVGFLAEAALEGGGWSASGGENAQVDPVTTAWAAMALRSASDAKLRDSKELIARAASWFRERSDAESGLFRTTDVAEPDYKATLSALMTRMFAGEKPGARPDFRTALDACIEARPEFLADPEYYYLTSVLAYQAAGDRWKGWSKVLKKTVLDEYDFRTPAPVDPDAPVCGSLGAIGFTILNLEIYFRYAQLIGAR